MAAVDCTELATVLNDIFELVSAREDVKTFADAVAVMQADLPGVTPGDISGAVLAVRRAKARPKAAPGKAARIKREAIAAAGASARQAARVEKLLATPPEKLTLAQRQELRQELARLQGGEDLDGAKERLERIEKALDGARAAKDGSPAPSADGSGPADELSSLAQALAKRFVKEGVRERGALLDAVHRELAALDPSISREEARAAISGYGKNWKMSQEEDDVALRDLKAQLLKESQLADLEAGRPPQRSGLQRDPASDEVRRLEQQVNEAKRKADFLDADPEKHLRTALGAVKTRLKHQISDLEAQLQAGERTVKGKTELRLDDEARDLAARRDELKRQFEAVFGSPGMSDAQRLEAAIRATEKSVAEYERRLREGDLAPGKKESRPLPQSPELDALRERRDELKVQLDWLRRLAAPREQSVAREIAKIEAQLSSGAFPEQAGPKATARTELEERLFELRQERAGILERRRKLERIERKLAGVKQRLATGEKLERDASGRPRVIGELESELKGLLARERRRDSLDARLKELEDQLSSGAFPERKGPAATVKTEIEAKIGELKAEVGARAAIRDAQKRLEELESGAYEPPSRPERIIGERLERAQLERDLLRGRIRRKLAELRPQSTFNRVVRAPTRLLGSLITSLEFSPTLIQGGFVALGHPVAASRALVRGMRAMGALGEVRAQRELEARPNYWLYQKAKLFLSDAEALSKREEATLSAALDRFPGFSHTARYYRQYLNSLRADLFDAMLAGLKGEAAPSTDELRAIAFLCNAATGRGQLGRHEASAATLADLAFAPRHYVSRVQMLTLAPLWKAPTWRVRKAVAQQYAQYLLGLASLLGVAALFGAQVEGDPRSSDFGKPRLGDRRYDFMSGFQQFIVAGVRVGAAIFNSLAGTDVPEMKRADGLLVPLRGKNVPYGGRTTRDVVFDFARGKSSPMLSIAADLATGKDMAGETVSALSVLKRYAGPITWHSVAKIMQNERHGLPENAAASLAALFGVNVSDYKERDVPEEASRLSGEYNLLQAKDPASLTTDELMRLSELKRFMNGKGGFANQRKQMKALDELGMKDVSKTIREQLGRDAKNFSR
jgi:hypothetical protein